MIKKLEIIVKWIKIAFNLLICSLILLGIDFIIDYKLSEEQRSMFCKALAAIILFYLNDKFLQRNNNKEKKEEWKLK